MSLRKRFLVGLTGLAALVMGAGIGCGSGNGGCKTDMDCRGERICDYAIGSCVEPGDDDSYTGNDDYWPDDDSSWDDDSDDDTSSCIPDVYSECADNGMAVQYYDSCDEPSGIELCLGDTVCYEGECVPRETECVPNTDTYCDDNIIRYMDDSCGNPGDIIEICDEDEYCEDLAGMVDPSCVSSVSCLPSTEICDGFDNDCDGLTDEGGVCTTSGTGDYCDTCFSGEDCLEGWNCYNWEFSDGSTSELAWCFKPCDYSSDCRSDFSCSAEYNLCLPDSENVCREGDVWIRDICDQWHERIYECSPTETCEEGECVSDGPECTPRVETFCDDGNVRWRNSCGNPGDIADYCSDDEHCEEGVCVEDITSSVRMSQITAGVNHTCGIKVDETIECWGGNDYGQASPPAGTFTQVSAGDFHNCGIRNDHTAECWGAGEGGEDGFLDLGQSNPLGGSFAQVSAGNFHTCGIRTTRNVQCWGDNEYGQGNPPIATFSSISAGGDYTCGITSSTVCWGRDSYGEASPPSETFIQIDAGWVHTCGIKSGGEVECWGGNDYGQSTPPLGTFTQISLGGQHTCGLRESEFVECWGSDEFGQATPPLYTFTQISAGGKHTCGIRTDNTVTCWGWNGFGQCDPPEE